MYRTERSSDIQFCRWSCILRYDLQARYCLEILAIVGNERSAILESTGGDPRIRSDDSPTLTLAFH
jgi:hypothetical protein